MHKDRDTVAHIDLQTKGIPCSHFINVCHLYKGLKSGVKIRLTLICVICMFSWILSEPLTLAKFSYVFSALIWYMILVVWFNHFDFLLNFMLSTNRTGQKRLATWQALSIVGNLWRNIFVILNRYWMKTQVSNYSKIQRKYTEPFLLSKLYIIKSVQIL